MKVSLWNWELEHIRRLNVRHHFKGRHEFRQIEKLGKPCLGPVAGSRLSARSVLLRAEALSGRHRRPAPLRGQLDGCNRFAKITCPVVKMQKPHSLQSAVLQVSLNGVKLDHGV